MTHAIEAKFVTLFEAIGKDYKVASIYVRRRATASGPGKNIKRGRRLTPPQRKAFMPKLVNAGGELYGLRWEAGSEACKALKYETICVELAELEERDKHFQDS
jgi:hypothetical protein